MAKKGQKYKKRQPPCTGDCFHCLRPPEKCHGGSTEKSPYGETNWGRRTADGRLGEYDLTLHPRGGMWMGGKRGSDDSK